MSEFKDNFVEALRRDLVAVVQDKLTPAALHYQYADVPLESNIKWKPVVLLLGNYSSGKSTLINELLGMSAQDTGQAPTDDSFTVLTYAEGAEGQVVEQKDGQALLHDERYPFKLLRKHGDRFRAHFRMKGINSPFLQELALIDTPGMLDSSSERDRGYDYQEVIGDLAQIADLILILFDPHKAGTVREAHMSLRETLPRRTFEDRVVFVLNRVDECQSLNDLLRVYGTLCWNLSQMTGRKDIPMIHLTYSEAASATGKAAGSEEFLRLLQNQREELRRKILSAPQYRLDHLAGYIETHGERLSHFLEAIVAYRKRRLGFIIKSLLLWLLGAAAAGGVSWLVAVNHSAFANAGEVAALIAAASIFGIVSFCGVLVTQFAGATLFHRGALQDLDRLTRLGSQARQDSWAAVEGHVRRFLKETKGRFSLKRTRRDWRAIEDSYKKASKDAREALTELSRVRLEHSP